MKIKFFFILLVFALTSCWQYDSDSKKLPGNYNICWVDNMRWQTIMYNSNGHGGGSYEVDPYIFSVGYNDKFIIAKQHPLCKDYLDSNCFPDQNVINYFIINVIDREKFGPFSENEFQQKKKELNIEDIKFTINFDEVPHD